MWECNICRNCPFFYKFWFFGWSNMYPNILSEQVVLDFQRPLELEVDEVSGDITTEWSYEWQFWLLEDELYCYLDETWVKIAVDSE